MRKKIKSVLSNLRQAIKLEFVRRRLRSKRPTVPSDGISVSYGPALGSQLIKGVNLTGGAVKLAYVHRRFPHSDKTFNILYLVSSCLPPYVEELVDWARRSGVSIVLNQNGVAYSAWTRDFSKINGELARLHRKADFVIYQTTFCKLAADRFYGKPLVEWMVLPNCVDLDMFTSISRAKTDALCLLVAGTHYQRERVTLALQVVRRLIDMDAKVSLRVAGRLAWPGAGDEVKDLIDKLDISNFVDIVGPYANADAPILYMEADVLLHLKYKDPCPNVVIESLASGVPVVGSNTGGLPELVGSEGGILVPVRDTWEEMLYPSVDEIVTGIVTVMERLPEYRLNARKLAERHHSSINWVETHSILFEKIRCL